MDVVTPLVRLGSTMSRKHACLRRLTVIAGRASKVGSQVKRVRRSRQMRGFDNRRAAGGTRRHISKSDRIKGVDSSCQ